MFLSELEKGRLGDGERPVSYELSGRPKLRPFDDEINGHSYPRRPVEAATEKFFGGILGRRLAQLQRVAHA